MSLLDWLRSASVADPAHLRLSLFQFAPTAIVPVPDCYRSVAYSGGGVKIPLPKSSADTNRHPGDTRIRFQNRTSRIRRMKIGR